jgi:hypothetical protein
MDLTLDAKFIGSIVFWVIASAVNYMYNENRVDDVSSGMGKEYVEVIEYYRAKAQECR